MLSEFMSVWNKWITVKVIVLNFMRIILKFQWLLVLSLLLLMSLGTSISLFKALFFRLSKILSMKNLKVNILTQTLMDSLLMIIRKNKQKSTKDLSNLTHQTNKVEKKLKNHYLKSNNKINNLFKIQQMITF